MTAPMTQVPVPTVTSHGYLRPTGVRIYNEAVDIHMPAASKNVNLKHNTMKNKNVSRHHDGVCVISFPLYPPHRFLQVG